MIHKDVPKFHMCCNCCRKFFNNPRCRDPHQHLPANRLQRSLPINIYICVYIYILHVITCACNSTLKFDNTWYIYIHIYRINNAINLLISQTGAWFVSDLGYPQHVTNSAKETAPSLPSACGASEARTVGGFSLVNDQLWGMSPNIMWFWLENGFVCNWVCAVGPAINWAMCPAEVTGKVSNVSEMTWDYIVAET